ncbi:MAG: porin [Desulfobacterales bacterium]
MMKKAYCTIVLMAVLASLSSPTWAGVKLKISEDTDIDLGFRLQTLFRATDNKDGTTGDSAEDFLVRRARIRLGGNVTKWMSFFLQTEAANDSGTGLDMRVIDAFVTLNLNPLAQIYLGENMAPAGRQITTSSGALMAMDRPNITNYNLTWGLNGRIQYNTANFPNGNLDLSGEVNVRDLGATLFGFHSFSDMVHLKYYAGVYNGIQNSGGNKKRYTGRVQMNFFDPEPGYYNLSTYVGEKRTIGVGFSYDAQNDIAEDVIKGNIDYGWWSADLFADLPLGPGFITAEGGYQHLDLDNATELITDASGLGIQNAELTQGEGWYTQIGYLIESWKLQPWAAYSKWNATDDRGSFYDWQVGLTYFFKGNNANIKAGYEYLKSDKNMGASNEDSIKSFLVGFYVTY